MYVEKQSVQEVNFLASAKFQNYTRQISDEGVVADSKGKKIVRAGTVYRNENGVAIGLVFADVDVTHGPQAGAVMYQGIVLGNRLPQEVSEKDKETMKGILFKDEYEAQDFTYVATTDTKYQAGTTYYSKSGNAYTKLVAGTDYQVGADISGIVYVIA